MNSKINSQIMILIGGFQLISISNYSFLKVYSPQGSSLAEGEMQLRENKWYCRIDCKTYLKAIMLILLIAILTATLLILFVKTNKQPIGEIYTEKGIINLITV